MMTESTGQDLNRREVIGLLEFELEQLRAEEIRPGWTRWALLAALGGVGWLLAEHLFADLDWPLVAVFWTFGWIGFHTIALGCDAVQPKLRTPGRSRFARASAQYGHGRVLTLVFVVQWGIVGAIVWSSPVLTGSWARVLTLGLAAFFLLFQLLVLLLSVVPRLLALNPNWTRASTVITTVIVVWPVVCLAMIASRFAGLVDGDLAAELRVAGLLVATSYLVEAFSKTTQPRPLHRSLLELRRDLALGHIPLASAARQVDIALRGESVPDLFQEDVDHILGLIRDARAAVAGSYQIVLEMVKLPGKADDRDSSQSTLLEALVARRSHHLGRASEMTDEAQAAVESLFARAKQVRPTASRELDELFESLRAAIEAEGAALKADSARHRELVRKWKDGELSDGDLGGDPDEPVH